VNVQGGIGFVRTAQSLMAPTLSKYNDLRLISTGIISTAAIRFGGRLDMVRALPKFHAFKFL